MSQQTYRQFQRHPVAFKHCSTGTPMNKTDVIYPDTKSVASSSPLDTDIESEAICGVRERRTVRIDKSVIVGGRNALEKEQV